jgi:hypothetical protein
VVADGVKMWGWTVPELVVHAAYCTAGDSRPRLYIAFNMFRFAGIIHGIKARTIRVTAASANAEELIEAADFCEKSVGTRKPRALKIK